MRGKAEMNKNKFSPQTAQKKLEQFAMLYEIAWELKRAALSKRFPNETPEEIKKMTARIFMLAKT
jgi:hypothetical protein